MDCILGMEFITKNDVLIEKHNRLIRIPSKSVIVRVKAHELWRTPKSRGEPTRGSNYVWIAESWDLRGAPDFQH